MVLISAWFAYHMFFIPTFPALLAGHITVPFMSSTSLLNQFHHYTDYQEYLHEHGCSWNETLFPTDFVCTTNKTMCLHWDDDIMKLQKNLMTKQHVLITSPMIMKLANFTDLIDVYFPPFFFYELIIPIVISMQLYYLIDQWHNNFYDIFQSARFFTMQGYNYLPSFSSNIWYDFVLFLYLNIDRSLYDRTECG